jgi:formyltetrahydrofolate-dependent phosphoribosylglycinamide formyltransferase
MWKGLEKKWKVSKGRVLLILMTFAIGGSLTGYAGKKIMRFTGIENPAAYIPVYILLITLLWPFLVLCVSIFTGQFGFFRMYIKRLGSRMGFSRQLAVGSRQLAADSRQQVAQTRGSSTSLPPRDKNIIIFASGKGSNAQRIIDYFRGTDIRVCLIACNKKGAGVLTIAEKERIPVLLIEKERFFRGDAYLAELIKFHPALLVLAGFLWKVPDVLIQAFQKKIINIHPALLPKHGGKGMYGQFVHEAVVQAGDLESGITVHYVDEQYDNGDVIFQTACPVLEGDTPEKLAARIHELEHLHYPAVIEGIVRRQT